MKKKRHLLARIWRRLLCFFLRNRRCCESTCINRIPVTAKLPVHLEKKLADRLIGEKRKAKKKPSVIRKKRTTTNLKPKPTKSVAKKKKRIVSRIVRKKK